MNSLRLEARISELMSRFVAQIKHSAAVSRTDLNRAAQTVLVPILREIYGYTSLENLDYTECDPNYPSIDLGDKVARVAFQVTSTPKLEKVKQTLKKFIEHQLDQQYDRVIVYILTEKQGAYSEVGIQSITQGKLSFDIASDIWDSRTLIKDVSNLPLEKIQRVAAILEAYFGEPRGSIDWELRDTLVQTLQHYTNQVFVPRQEQERLDQFLQNRANGLFLITGRAGIGKTALLANWIDALDRERVCLIYQFFSQRDSATRSLLRAYRNLLQCLHECLGIGSSSIPTDIEGLRREIYNLLRDEFARANRPFVIVLDGLDEAEDIFTPLFPHSLPPSVFIVAAVRSLEGETWYQQWKSAADEHLELNQLPRSAIVEWLKQTDNNELIDLSTDSNFIAQLDQITQGYPLYLHFLIEDLIARPEAVNQIVAESPKEFGEYVKTQFQQLAKLRELQQSAVRDLFTLLVASCGALSIEDIQDLTGLSLWELEGLPWQVKRWFSFQDNCYSFVHPLLSQEFQQVLGRDAIVAQQKLVEYCQRWDEHHSSYALRYLTEHLQQRQSWYELFGLARNLAFIKAQHARFPSEPNLPLRTIQIALKGAVEADDAAAMAEFSLQHAHFLAETTLKGSPLTALRSGNLKRALSLIELYQSQIEFYILWNLLLGWELKDNHQHDEANQVLKALSSQNLPQFSRKERSDFWKCHLLTNLLIHVFEVNPNICIKLGQTLLDPNDYDSMCRKLCERGYDSVIFDAVKLEVENELAHSTTVFGMRRLQEIVEIQARRVDKGIALQSLSEIAKLLLTPGWELSFCEAWARIACVGASLGERALSIKYFTQAITTAKTMENEERKFQDFSSIVYYQKKVGESDLFFLPIALETWRSAEFTQLTYQTKVLVEIASLQVELWRQDEAEVTLKQAIELNKRVKDSEARAEAWIAISKGLIDAGKLALVVESYQTKTKYFNALQDPVLSHVVLKQIEGREFDLALETALQIENQSSRDDVLSKIAIAQIDQLDFDAALTTITQIEARYQKDAALIHAVEIQIQQSSQSNNLDRILDTVWQINAYTERTKALSLIVKHQLNQQNFEAAYRTAQLIEDEEYQASTKRLFALAYAEVQEFSQALALAAQIDDREVQSQTLNGIASAQIKLGEFEAARSTLSRLLSTEPETEVALLQAWSLLEIATLQLQSNTPQAALTTTQAAAQFTEKIQDQFAQAQVIAVLAKCWAKLGSEYREKSEQALRRVFKAATEIRAKQERREAWSIHNPCSHLFAIIARTQAELGDFEAALKTNELVTVASIKAYVFGIIAQQQVEQNSDASQKEHLGAVLADAYEQIEQSDPFFYSGLSDSVRIHCTLAVAQSIVGDQAAALETLVSLKEQAEDDRDRDLILANVAIAEITIDSVETAMKTLDKIGSLEWQLQVFWAMASHQFNQGLKSEVRLILEKTEACVQRMNPKAYLSSREKMIVMQAMAGNADQAISAALQLGKNRTSLLATLTRIFAKAGDRASLKRLLIPCADYPEAVYQICESLAQLYPQQSSEIAATAAKRHSIADTSII
ncbi:MAG: SMEK domain-containing protein [Phormidium tanganyikae FI6-MK23]|jgi:hypothetical protein|nr:SMEK domain-containing protein [Phormidium tanganyikae FI6-MK23]